MFLLLEIFPMQCMEMLLWGDRSIDICSTYLAAEECSSVCAWWCTQKFCKTTPKISQKASPSMNKELLLSLTFGKKKISDRHE